MICINNSQGSKPMSDVQYDDSFVPQREKIPAEPPGIPYDPSPRPGLDELSAAERLILWAIRALAEGPSNWSLVQKELWLCCGPVTIETVLQSLHEMLTVLAVHRRRILTVGKIPVPRLSADEVTLLSLVAAAQCHHASKAEAITRWLVRNSGQEPMMASATRFAESLTRSGIRLTLTTAA